MNKKEKFVGALKAKVPIYHSICGNIAFYYNELPVPGERISVARVTLLDGARPFGRSEMRCGSCDNRMDPSQLRTEKP